jgi:hypothetical protein
MHGAASRRAPSYIQSIMQMHLQACSISSSRTLGQKLGLLQSPSADQVLLLNRLPWHSVFLEGLHIADAVLAPEQQAPEQNIRELQAVLDDDHVPSQSASATLLSQPQSRLQHDPTGSRVGCVCRQAAGKNSKRPRE